jgi:AcrR family transcriptional regulator
MASRSERTTERLQSTALRLFLDHGYDETSVAAIAAEAGVSQMTFFRHFPTKESVVVGDPYDPLIAEAVRRQPADLGAFERVRRGLLGAWASMPEPGVGETRDRIRLAVSHPALRAAMHENLRETQTVVEAALRETGADRFEALVATGACLGAVMAALVDWGLDPDSGPIGSSVIAALAALPHPASTEEPAHA